MLFKNITINNFRNFENVEINLSNKNIFFGLNDVGKTNLLYALRYLFDNEIRRKGFIDSDFYRKKINEPIEIILEIDISEDENEDNQKLRAAMRGNILSETEIVYIKLFSEYDDKLSNGNIILFWGYDPENLSEMDNKGYLMAIDKVFEVTYIDSYVDLYNLFRKNAMNFIINDQEADKEVFDEIDNSVKSLNENISKLSGIKKFEENILPEYKKFKNDDIKVSIKSEFALKGFYYNLVPYVKNNQDDKEYPTSGDGRKKILTYSLYDLINIEKSESKIIIHIIEEPENHLHKASQLALSRTLFNNEAYKYLFVSTHSPYIIKEMDNTNLVRIYNEDGISANSYLYTVPEEFQRLKQLLNDNLSEAIFGSKVLLVEGPSEEVLFKRILSVKNPNYEILGTYILTVNGIGFPKYKEVLSKLGIEVILRTDNDLRSHNDKYIALGFSRCNNLSNQGQILPSVEIEGNSVEDKRNLFDTNIQAIKSLAERYKIFLSRVDLENDLDEIFHDKMKEYLNVDDPVLYLQRYKHTRMYELVKKITDDDCEILFESERFKILKEI